MLKTRFILFGCCLFLFSGCGLFSLHLNNQGCTELTLGGICKESNYAFSANRIYMEGFPIFRVPLRVGVTVNEMKKKDYHRYFSTAKCKGIIINKDSIEEPRSYLKIVLLDNIGLIETLKSSDNSTLYDYIKNDSQSKIITTVTVSVSDSIIEQTKNMDVCYLKTGVEKRGMLYLYKDGIQVMGLDLQESYILSYELSRFCWGGNRKKGITIHSIIKDGESCPAGMTFSAEELERLPLIKY